MKIRNAEKKDINKILELLFQVGSLHHNERPDLFKDNCTKYTKNQISDIIDNKNTPIFVSVDENDDITGYVFCIIQNHNDDNILTDIKTLYIDDLCVDEKMRGNHIGIELYNKAVSYAKYIGCYNVTLNVWASNKSAIKFYERCGLKPQKIGLEYITED